MHGCPDRNLTTRGVTEAGPACRADDLIIRQDCAADIGTKVADGGLSRFSLR